jgi:GTP-binding protein HflX
MELHENTVKPERTLLISVDTGEYDAEASLDELEELAFTAGADVVAKVSQKLSLRQTPILSVKESLKK